MDFLTLCQEMRSQARVSGSGPVAVTGQSGIHLRVVEAIRDAWLRLQSHPKRWKWMWRDAYGLETIGATRDYTLSEVDELLGAFTAYDKALGVTSRFRLTFMDWADFSAAFGALQTVATGKPHVVTQRPDGSLRFYPTPDKAYVVDFEYMAAPQRLQANGDTPGMPTKFHQLIIDEALIPYATALGATDIKTKAVESHARLLHDLIWDQELRRERHMTVRAE